MNKTPKVHDYMVVTDTTSNALSNQVEFWLRKGWQPLGGVAFTQHPNMTTHHFLFAQAMTLSE